MGFIPVEITFQTDFNEKEEFLNILAKKDAFLLVDDKYLFTLTEIIVNRESGLKQYIKEHTPSISHMFSVKVHVGYKEMEGTFNIIYDKSTVSGNLDKIVVELNKRWNQIKENNLGLNFYKKYINTPYMYKNLAEAYFYTKEFKLANDLFSKIRQNYPEYSNRMLGLCEIFQNKPTNNAVVFDGLIYYNRIGDLYKTRRLLDDKTRAVVELYLVQKALKDRKSLLINYLCYRNSLRKVVNVDSNQFLQNMQNILKNHRERAVLNEQKELFTKILNKIKLQ
ncbi:hypothetical protein NUSPORA_00085 [Nucleospora cyclopteri]